MKKLVFIFASLIVVSFIVSGAGGGSGGKSTPKAETPQVQQPEQIIKCSELSSLQERVPCRIKKINQGEETEFDPEECRSFVGTKRDSCLQTYSAAQSCWSTDNNDERIQCIKNFLKISSITEEKDKCSRLENTEKAQCIASLKERVFTMAKFRFYNLEERAEYFMREGANEKIVSDFIIAMELKKQEFNNADSIAEKKNTVLEAKEIWKEFIDNIRTQIQ